MCLFGRRNHKSEVAAAMLEGYARAYRVFQPQLGELKEKVNLLLQINEKLALQLNEVKAVAQEALERTAALQQSNGSILVEDVAVDAEEKNEECAIEGEGEEEEEANVLDEREEREDQEVVEQKGVEVMVTQVLLDERVMGTVETMAAEEEEELSDVEGVEEEVEAAGGQLTDQVVRPLSLSSNPWTRPTGHNQLNELVMKKEEVEATGEQPTGQVVWPPFLGYSIWSRSAEHSQFNQPDKKKGEEEEEMTEEDLEVARIMSNLPPIVPTIREQPRSWLYEYDSYYTLF